MQARPVRGPDAGERPGIHHRSGGGGSPFDSLHHGRGTPFGAPVPTLKIATNSALAGRKGGWIDYDAGGLARGEGWDEHTQALFRLVLDTASGVPTRSERAGFREIAIWKDGVTL